MQTVEEEIDELKERYSRFDEILQEKSSEIEDLKIKLNEANDKIKKLEPEITELTVLNEGLTGDVA